MSRLKQAVKMLRYNFSSIAFFEIVYRVLSLAILTPAMYGLLNVSIRAAGKTESDGYPAAWNRKCLPESGTEESAHTWVCIVCSAIHIFADIVRHVARLEAAGIFDTFSEEL